MAGRVRAGQCGRNSMGRRFCVHPDRGARLVPKDFDAEAEGFEVVEPEEDGESSVDGGGRLSTSDREFFRREIRAAVREELDADEDDLEDDDLEGDDLEDGDLEDDDLEDDDLEDDGFEGDDFEDEFDDRRSGRRGRRRQSFDRG